MNEINFENVKVAGIACAVPGKIVKADEYVKHFGQDVVDRFVESTGIVERHVNRGKQTASDLCCIAAKALMEKKGLSGEDFDAVVFITQSPDYVIPATAFAIQKRLGIKKESIVFDVNWGCPGFSNGIYLVAGMIQSGMISRALLLVGDSHIHSEDRNKVPKDKSFSMMFGDAGSACIVERGEGRVRGMIQCDGNGYDTLINPFPGARIPASHAAIDKFDTVSTKMDGDDVFLFAITKVPKLFKEFYKRFECSTEDYDMFALHQANIMILNTIAKKLKMPSEKVPISLDRYGNTDGASVPLSIVDAFEKEKPSKKQKVIACGYGVGLTLSVVDFELDPEDTLPVIVSDEYYHEPFLDELGFSS